MLNLLGQIIEESLNEVYIFDADSWRFVEVNRGARLNLGYSSEELLELTPVDLKPEITAERFAEMVEPLRHGRSEQIVFETVHRRKDGSTYDVAVSLQLFPTETTPVFVASVQDVTKRKEADRALRQNERRFRDFAEASSDWFWEMDRELRLTWVSDQMQVVTGFPPEKVIGRTREELGKPTADDEAWARHLDCLRAHRPFKKFRYRLGIEQGTEIWIDISGVPIFDDDGEFIGYRGVGSNVTGEVELQQRAEQAYTILEDATDSIADGFALFDADDRLVYTNENYRKALSAASDILEPGVRWEQLLRTLVERGALTAPPADRDAWIEEQIASHREPGGLRVQRTNDGRSLEIREYKTRDGGTVVIRADVTERKHAEEELRASEERLRNLTQSAHDAIVTGDESGNILSWNAAAVKIFGYTEAEALGAHLSMLIPERYREAHTAGMARFLSGNGGTVIGEIIRLETMRKDGTEFPVDLSLSTWISGGKRYYAGILRDVTERERAEQALQESERRLATLMANLPGMAYRCLNDNDWTMEFISDGVAALTGYGSQQLMDNAQLSYADLIRPDDREAVWEGVQAAVGERRAFELTYRINTAGGEEKWVWEKGTGVFSTDGELRALEGFVIDITERKHVEADLARQRGLFEGIFNAVPDAMVIANTEREIVLHNPSLGRVFGYEPGELLGSKTRILYESDEEFRKQGRQRFNVEAGASYAPYTVTYRRKGGEVFPGETVGSVVKDANGEVVGFVGVIRDVTERKRIEGTLRKLSRAVEQSPATVVITDTNGTIEYVNPKFEEMTGYAAEEVIGQNPRVLKSGNTSPDKYKEMWKTITGGGQWRGEFRNKKKNGELFWELATIGPIRAADGAITHFLAVKENITARKKANEKLKRSVKVEQSLNALLAISQMTLPIDEKLARGLKAISLVSSDSDTLGSAVFLADNGSQTLTLTAHQGLPPQLQKTCANVPFGHCLCGRAAATREIQFAGCVDKRHEIRFEGMHPHGHYIVPIVREGTLVGVLNVYVPHGHDRNHHEERFLMAAADVLAIIIDRDRAEQELLRHRDHLQDLVDSATVEIRIKAQELEAALAKERELNVLQRQFVSMASHEFRTPLTIIDGAAQRIQRRFGTLTAEDLGDRVSKIRGAVTRMTELIDSTLSAARMDAGKIDVSPVPCAVAALLAEVCERQQEIAATHRITMDAAGLPPSIIADPKALEQIFTNLLSNAVKYAPGKPDIEVAGRTEGEMAVVSVRDHGLGIPADDMSKMFGRYFRAKTSTGIAGTGIGLNLVKQLVELHRGSIHVDSVQGEGSTFTVKLPLDPDRLERRHKDRESGGPEAAPGTRAIPEINAATGV